MKRLALIVLAFPLMAFQCSTTQQHFEIGFPAMPDLPAETAKACPPADLVQGSLGDLATKDAALAIEYARCQARAASAVGAYQTAQRLLQQAQQMADQQKATAKPQ